MKQEDQAMIIAIVGAGLYMAVGDKVFAFLDKIEQIKQSLMTFKTLIIILIALSPLFLYIIYRISKRLNESISNIKEGRVEIADTKKEIEKLLNYKAPEFNKLELTQILNNLNYLLSLSKESRKLRQFVKLLTEKRESVKIKLFGLEKLEIIDNFENKKDKLQEEIKELDEQKEDRRLELENRNAYMRSHLGADRTEAFLRRDLIKEQIEALHEDGWENANEYDVMEKKTIPVVVKKIMNHSKTHTFLVWSVKRLLESLGIKAEKHDTKYPDITFFHDDEWWAIEIEKGSLLRKRNQMRKKVDFLNRIFPNRWMFVVTNKNYLPQYREWGPATPRSGVEKTIKNWLNSSI
mgnify:CR=1 FL=1